MFVFFFFLFFVFFFFSSRRRHTRSLCDWKFRRVLFRSLVRTRRCCMEPQISCTWVNLMAQHIEGVPFSAPHFAYLSVPTACYSYTKKVYVYYNIVHDLLICCFLFQHFNGFSKSLQGLLLAEELCDVEHARTLADAYKSKTEGVHYVAKLITLAFNPCHNYLLLVLD